MAALQGRAGRLCAAMAALLVLCAAPAFAQLDGPELAGSYPVDLRAQGGGCPPLRRTTFEVRSVSGNRLEVVLGGEWGRGELRGLFEGGQREFYLSYRALDRVPVQGMQGFFERRGGTLGVVIAVNFADGVDCTGELQGRRRSTPAPVQPPAPAPAQPATLPPEPGPTPLGPSANVAGPQTNSPEPKPVSGAAAPGKPPSTLLRVLKVAGIALLGFLLGFGIVRLFRRRRPE